MGDLRRFASPRSLMNFVGLTPSEHSSGQRERRGGITKCGNSHARRILIESAWAYRFPARVSRDWKVANKSTLSNCKLAHGKSSSAYVDAFML
ncbi:transposase [Shewanella indica]|uniref:transposase n=1 Tax=Shewanella indica TaxID=768528 RepID=UPI0023EE57EC|nr:transposase [Shewanella indica]